MFDVEPRSSCSYDYMKVYDGDSRGGSLMGKYCGNVAPHPLATEMGAMFIEFVTDTYNSYNGFQLSWKPAGKQQTIISLNDNDLYKQLPLKNRIVWI